MKSLNNKIIYGNQKLCSFKPNYHTVNKMEDELKLNQIIQLSEKIYINTKAITTKLAENPNKKLSSSVYISLYKRNLKMTYDKP